MALTKMNQRLINKIQKKCPMSFNKYMEIALYDSEFGYYTSHSEMIGRKGDFITAPELTPLFGAALARQIKEIMIDLNNCVILEIGAGTGRLCVNILNDLESNDSLPEIYYILEPSPSLKEKQKALLTNEVPHLCSKVVWLESWSNVFFDGVVIANEVLDAMPVHRFLWKNQEIYESYIDWDDSQGQLKEQFIKTKNQLLIDYVQGLDLGEKSYCSEVNLWIPGWLNGIWHVLRSGVLLLIDYGYPRKEYYHADRSAGTLMCHQKHRSYDNFLSQPGLADITAHVDFTHVAESALVTGFDVLGYCNQAAFLISNGILEQLAQETNEVVYYQEAQNLKILLQSQEMGELFKVLALGKNFDRFLSGFLLQDKRAYL